MVWAWLRRNRDRLLGKPAGSFSTDRKTFVPHAEWSGWLGAGQWDRAAVLLEQIRKNPADDTVERLLPEWESRLIDSFLTAGWNDLSTTTALRWLRRVDRFPDRGLKDLRLETFREAADQLWELERARATGDCREAMAHLDRARELIEEAGQESSSLAALRTRIADDHELLLQWTVAMRIHDDDGHIEEALAVSRRILAIAPRHKGAQALAKRLGHFAASTIRADLGGLATEIPHQAMHTKPGGVDCVPAAPAVMERQIPRSVNTIGQLSVDRADTWLVTLADTVEFSPAADSRYADLVGSTEDSASFRLQRDAEGCWLFTSEYGLIVDGKLQRSGCLIHGSVIRPSGGSVEFRFVQPWMETGTARLQRTDRPSSKGVRGLLLMGEMFRIGGTETEVPHPEIAEPLLIARSAAGWLATRRNSWMIEGVEMTGRASLQPPCRLRVESVGIFWES